MVGRSEAGIKISSIILLSLIRQTSFHDLEGKNTPERRMTAIILKQDPNIWKDKTNAIYYDKPQSKILFLKIVCFGLPWFYIYLGISLQELDWAFSLSLCYWWMCPGLGGAKEWRRGTVNRCPRGVPGPNLGHSDVRPCSPANFQHHHGPGCHCQAYPQVSGVVCVCVCVCICVWGGVYG